MDLVVIFRVKLCQNLSKMEGVGFRCDFVLNSAELAAISTGKSSKLRLQVTEEFFGCQISLNPLLISSTVTNYRISMNG